MDPYSPATSASDAGGDVSFLSSASSDTGAGTLAVNGAALDGSSSDSDLSAMDSSLAGSGSQRPNLASEAQPPESALPGTPYTPTAHPSFVSGGGTSGQQGQEQGISNSGNSDSDGGGTNQALDVGADPPLLLDSSGWQVIESGGSSAGKGTGADQRRGRGFEYRRFVCHRA
jgi:hypothetical protein